MFLFSVSTDGATDVQYGSPPCSEITWGVYEPQRATSDPAHAPWLPIGLCLRAQRQPWISATSQLVCADCQGKSVPIIAAIIFI